MATDTSPRALRRRIKKLEDLVAEAYATTEAVGLDFDALTYKAPVRLAVTSNIADRSACSTTFGGGTIVEGNRVGLFGQSTASQSGVYIAGAPAGGVCALSRADDFDEDSEVTEEVVIAVQEGDAAGKRYRVSAAGVVGTDAITFAELPNATDKTKIDQNFSARQNLSGAGAVSLTTRYTRLTSSGIGQAITLADGSFVGQRKTIRAASGHGGGNTQVLTPATFADGTTVTFDAVGEVIELEWQTGGWCICSLNGATVA